MACERFLIDDVGKFGDKMEAPGSNQKDRSNWFNDGQAVDFKIPVSCLLN